VLNKKKLALPGRMIIENPVFLKGNILQAIKGDLS